MLLPLRLRSEVCGVGAGGAEYAELTAAKHPEPHTLPSLAAGSQGLSPSSRGER